MPAGKVYISKCYCSHAFNFILLPCQCNNKNDTYVSLQSACDEGTCKSLDLTHHAVSQEMHLGCFGLLEDKADDGRHVLLHVIINGTLGTSSGEQLRLVTEPVSCEHRATHTAAA